MTLREQFEKREHDILSPYASFSDQSQGREHYEEPCDLRPVYQRDRDRILHCKSFRRLKGKTQVFLSPEGDHYRTRLTHTLEVSQNARTVAKALCLNEDLTEAIALGHDLGHTPFGHAGERFLNALYNGHTGRLFNHNIHSARVLDHLIFRNVSLQVLDGVICHNGELEQQEYKPKCFSATDPWGEFDANLEDCYTDSSANKRQIPGTLEGCIMRISDIIAYLGKDRQDAVKIGLIENDDDFTSGTLGTTNAQIINNMTVSIIEHSYGKPYISMDKEVYETFSNAKKENYQTIYNNPKLNDMYNNNIQPMFHDMYEALLTQAKRMDQSSILYKHHINYIRSANQFSHYFDIDKYMEHYLSQDPNEIVVDFMASMTDDYFIDLYNYLFPNGSYKVDYIGYFD